MKKVDISSDAGVKPSLWSLVKRFPNKLRELGLLGALELVVKNLRAWVQDHVDRKFDRRLGVKTAGYTYLEDLDIESPNKELGIRYQPTTHKRMVAMFANLPKDLKDFTFVDFGSGRGRVLMFASRFNFRRVLGVEFSEELYRSSLDNLSRAGLDPRRVQPHHQDATTFDLPAGPLVLYFFDPFRERVMQQVIDNITRSYQASPRTIYFMYLAPVHEAMVEASGIFHRVPTPDMPHEYSLPNQYRFTLFSTVP